MNGTLGTKSVRPSKDGVRARLAEAGMNVPEECVHGTLVNLTVLQDHVLTLRAFPLNDRDHSALEFLV